MKTLVVALFLALSTSLRTEAQATLGSVIYSLSSSAGKFLPISDTTGTVQTGDLFYAELWAAKAPAAEPSLSPILGSLVQWTYGVGNSGYPSLVKKLEIPGTEGSDTGTIQLRVWKATVMDWQSALSQNLPRGSSPMANIKLGGASADGTLSLPINTGTVLEGVPIIPEPSSLVLVMIGTALWATGRKHRNQRKSFGVNSVR